MLSHVPVVRQQKIIGSHKTTEENKIFSLKVGVIIVVTVKTR